MMVVVTEDYVRSVKTRRDLSSIDSEGDRLCLLTKDHIVTRGKLSSIDSGSDIRLGSLTKTERVGKLSFIFSSREVNQRFGSFQNLKLASLSEKELFYLSFDVSHDRI